MARKSKVLSAQHHAWNIVNPVTALGSQSERTELQKFVAESFGELITSKNITADQITRIASIVYDAFRIGKGCEGFFESPIREGQREAQVQ